MPGKEVLIVIPVYKPPTPEEYTALLQCFKVLGKYDITLVHPHGFEISTIQAMHPVLQATPLDAHWFESIHTYNRLVLSPLFYELFADYSYILIYQPDAYVFRDELKEWVHKGYDYIGAPWIPNSRKYEHRLGRMHLNFRIWWDHKILHRRITSVDRHYKVGNGGFSLRKVAKMIEVTTTYEKEIQHYLSEEKKYFGEDVFFSIYIKDTARLRIPSYKEALRFAFEINPNLAFRLNGNKLPFGCHDWPRKKRWESFWKKYIQMQSPASPSKP